MSRKRVKKVGLKFAKREFTTVGLTLCLYAIFVLYLPTVLHYYMNIEPSFELFLKDPFSVVGLYYLIYVVGTFIAFAFMKMGCKVNFKDFWRKSKITTKALFNEVIVFCAIGTACLFATMAINSYIPIGNSIVSPIGMVFANAYYDNILYIFIFAVASPIMEEIAFRGILFRSLGRYGNRFALYMTAFFYAIMHVHISEMVPAFILSLFLSNLTMHYRSIQPAILAHVAFKSILMVMSFTPYEYYNVFGLILLGIYIYALYLTITKKHRFAKLKSRRNSNLVYKLFLTRPAVIVALIVVFAHSLVIGLFGWIV